MLSLLVVRRFNFFLLFNYFVLLLLRVALPVIFLNRVITLTGVTHLQVGTGFSFADDAGYARNEADVAENLLK